MHLVNHFIQKHGRQDPVTIAVIGAGGNGSHFLYCLAALQGAMTQIRDQVFDVCVYDDDTVNLHNCGRQLFFEQEVGFPKAQCLVERINRSYGYDWKWESKRIEKFVPRANIIVTCTDNIASRKNISLSRQEKLQRYLDHLTQIYWIDMGNGKNTGNVVLSTMYRDKNSLPDVFEVFRGMENQEEDDTPSCGMAESLLRQDLYINRVVATMAAKTLKTLLTESAIPYHGIVMDIDEMQMAKIPC